MAKPLGQPIMRMAKEGQSEMPDFEFMSPEGKRFTVTGQRIRSPPAA
jgi:hypothetical protein